MLALRSGTISSLPFLRLQRLAINVGYLRRTKEEADNDRQSWEVRMGRYKKGVGAVQEDGIDDDIVPLSLPGHQLDAIVPTLSHFVLSDEDLKALRSRFLLDQSIKNAIVLVGTWYTLNEKQLPTTSMHLKRGTGTPSGEGVGYQTYVSDQFISYIGGTEGTGKTLLIRAFLLGLAILDKLEDSMRRSFWLHQREPPLLILAAPRSMPLSG
jgi:hypothetical protein